MTDKPKAISDTARALLTAAAARGDYIVRPLKLPIAAARQVVRSLLNAGLVEEVSAPIADASFAWPAGEGGGLLMLRATAVGRARVAEVVGEQEAPAHDTGDAPDGGAAAPANAHSAEASDGTWASPAPTGREIGLRRAALALLDAWDRHCDHDAANEMTGRVATLRAALRPKKPSGNPDPRPETKQAQVLAMLRRSPRPCPPGGAEQNGRKGPLHRVSPCRPAPGNKPVTSGRR